MKTPRLRWAPDSVPITLLLGALGACGAETIAPPPPVGSAAAVIEVAPDGLRPRDVNVESGQALRFVNLDVVAHEFRSDPHPAHGACPELDLGPLRPGGQALVTFAGGARTCGFHDELRPDDERFQGTVRVVLGAPSAGRGR